MNCSRTKELLSEYIDGLLDKEQEALVKDHLLLCGDCRDEFESMKAIVREMGSLDTIKAPDDFLVSLHGRIKSDSWFQKVKAFLFIPARIRIPVELATLATAVVIGFFIFYIVPPVQLSNTTPSKSPTDLKDKKPEVEIQSNENSPAGADNKSIETRSVSDKNLPESREKREPLKQDYQRSEPASSPVTATYKINEPLQLVLVLKPVFDKEPVSQGKKDDAGLYQEKPVFSYQEGLLLNIKEHIKSAGGSILKTDMNKETGQPEYLLIEISGQDYQKLVEKLGEFGKIQTSFAADAGQFKQLIQVRIHLLINK